MIPIRDDNPQLRTPIVTYTLIGINILVWFGIQGMGSHPSLTASICQFGVIPASLFGSGITAINDLATASDLVACVQPNTGWWSLIASMFMHAGWLHIIGNLWFLWIFGDNVEDAMGGKRFLLFYLLSGLCASMAQILANTASHIPMIGASGAIGGVMGAYILLYPKVSVHLFFLFTTFRIPAFVALGYWLAVQLLGGIASSTETGGVAYWAHLGGFIAGGGLAMLLKNDKLLDAHPYHGWR